MKDWYWIPILLAAGAAHYVVPASWFTTIGWVGATFIAAYIGGRIDSLQSRIAELEGTVAGHEAALDSLRRELSVDVSDRLFEIEKRL